MNLKQFLDAGYVLLIEEYQRIGVDLLSAIEKTQEWSAGFEEGQEPVPEHGRQNEQAMAALTARLGGVQGSPV